MDDLQLGRIPAQRELPEPVKFAWPIMILPDLFATPRHLALVLGYLASIGWETFVPNLRAAFGQGSTPPLEKLRFNDLAAIAGEALDAIGRDAVVLGHGVGGLVALKLSGHRQSEGRGCVRATGAGLPHAAGGRTRESYRDDAGQADQAADRQNPVRVDRRFRSVHARGFDKSDGAGLERAGD